MSSIGDVLSRKKYSEPDEIEIIKKYVRDKFDSDVSISIQPQQIIIKASSSALAGTLRLHSHELTELCQTDKRLVFRVGN